MLLFATALGQAGVRDSAFDGLPFDQWLNGPDQSHIRWTTGLSDTTLSPHQRLNTRVFAEVDGREIAKRRGEGKLLILVQIDDEQGGSWQSHVEMDLEHVEEGIKSNDALFSVLFFVLPGDYRVNIGLYDTATREHAISKRHLHVSALRSDPLPDGWNGLPRIDFIDRTMQPDGWYLPAIQSTLNLKVETRKPLDVRMLVNLTPSERLAGSSRVQNRNLSVLLPSTKIFSCIDWGKSLFDAELVDLSRRRVAYEGEGLRCLDWAKASTGLSVVNPGIIDVNSLQNRWYAAQFFLDEINRQIARGTRQKALIILSSPVEFEGGQDVRLPGPELAKNTTIFYVRYQPPVFQRPRGREMGRGPAPSFPPIDQLAGLLKALEPHIYDVQTPEQFRKVLATVLGEIAKL